MEETGAGWMHWCHRYPSYDHFRAAILVNIDHDLRPRQRQARRFARPSPDDPHTTLPIPELAEAVKVAEATTEAEVSCMVRGGTHDSKQRRPTRRRGHRRRKTQKLPVGK